MEPTLERDLRQHSELTRLEVERHGAIRVGTSAELKGKESEHNQNSAQEKDQFPDGKGEHDNGRDSLYEDFECN
ncbi:hypothetical protein QWA_18422 [Alcaligenes faecalis subsp. faecalis NCIB 8687]|nr:hypothetical protein QWA_18422 [Alcaligenes faecalis subsp. faecalis NCIB 8687]